PPPALGLQQGGGVPAPVAGSAEDLEPEIADVDGGSLFELHVYFAGLEPVFRRVDPRLLGHVQAKGSLVAIAKSVGNHTGHVDGGTAQQLQHERSPAGMISVAMGENDVPDPGRVETVPAHVLDDGLGSHPGPHVDQGQFAAAVKQIYVAVIRVGEVEAHSARAHQMDPVPYFHDVSRMNRRSPWLKPSGSSQ